MDSDIERRFGVRRNDVDPIAGLDDVRGDRRAQHRRVPGLVFQEELVGGIHGFGVGAEDVQITLRLFGRRDRRQAPEVCARDFVQPHRRLPRSDSSDRICQVDDRVRPQRHRSVPGRAARSQFDTSRDLLERLHRREFHLPALPCDAAAFSETELCLDLREVLAHDILDPDARRSFLPGLGEKDDVAIERHVLPLQRQHHHQRGDEVVLVVHRAAAVDVTAIPGGGKRRVASTSSDRR